MKELNKMLGIETKLSTSSYLQTDGQIGKNKPETRIIFTGLC